MPQPSQSSRQYWPLMDPVVEPATAPQPFNCTATYSSLPHHYNATEPILAMEAKRQQCIHKLSGNDCHKIWQFANARPPSLSLVSSNDHHG